MKYRLNFFAFVGIPYASHKRLLNINGYAKSILKTYKGPFIAEEVCEPIQLVYSKEKKQFTTLLHDTLNSLLASDANLKKDIDSNMGFLFGELENIFYFIVIHFLISSYYYYRRIMCARF